MLCISCSFGDRGKRLKLQQFLAKKADALYDKANLEKSAECIKQELGDEGNNFLKNISFFFFFFFHLQEENDNYI